MGPRKRTRTTSNSSGSGDRYAEQEQPTTKYTGVSRYVHRSKSVGDRSAYTAQFIAQFKVSGRSFHLGVFNDEIRAATAYDMAMRLLETTPVGINFPNKKNHTVGINFPNKSIHELQELLTPEQRLGIENKVAEAKALKAAYAEQHNDALESGSPDYSRYFGVRRIVLRGHETRWESRLQKSLRSSAKKGYDISLRSYQTEQEAAYAVDLARRYLYLNLNLNERGKLNFPDEDIASLQNKLPSTWEYIRDKIAAATASSQEISSGQKLVRMASSEPSTSEGKPPLTFSSTTTTAPVPPHTNPPSASGSSTTMPPPLNVRHSPSISSSPDLEFGAGLDEALTKDPDFLSWLKSLPSKNNKKR